MSEVSLTREQLKAVTGGKRPKEIIQWLRNEGFTFRIDLHGWPVVHPDHYAQQMGVKGKGGREARERAKGRATFEKALEEMRAEEGRRTQLAAERSRIKAERDRAVQERKRLRAEERQRRAQEKAVKQRHVEPPAPPRE